MLHPKQTYFRGHRWFFDCIGGTGEPIYVRTDDQNNRYHCIVIKKEMN